MKGFQIQQKGERRISAALRIMLVVVLLAVQIGFVVAISYFMQEYLALAYGVVQVGALFLAVHIYNEPGELSYKLIWFILLLLAPPVGMILWFLWGGAAQKRHLPQNTKRFPDEPESVRMRSEIAVDKLTRQLPAWSRVTILIKVAVSNQSYSIIRSYISQILNLNIVNLLLFIQRECNLSKISIRT